MRLRPGPLCGVGHGVGACLTAWCGAWTLYGVGLETGALPCCVVWGLALVCCGAGAWTLCGVELGVRPGLGVGLSPCMVWGWGPGPVSLPGMGPGPLHGVGLGVRTCFAVWCGSRPLVWCGAGVQGLPVCLLWGPVPSVV